MYECGYGVPEDQMMALEWYYEVVDYGYVKGWSDYTKGHIHIYGVGGLAQDLDVIYNWLHNAAQQGNVFAQFEVARVHFHGIYGPVDNLKGMEWTLKAA